MPPASMPPKTPRIVVVKKVPLRRLRPRLPTVQATETSGIIATAKAPVTSVVIRRSTNLRRPRVFSNTSDARGVTAGAGRLGASVAISVGSREFLAPRDDPARGHVDGHRDDEEGQAGRDQDAHAGRVRIRELC